MIVSSSTAWLGTWPWSKRSVCEPLPFRPSRSPHDPSTITNSLRGARNMSWRPELRVVRRIGHERLAHVVRRVGRAGAVGDAARELPAVGGPLRDADRRGHRRRAEVAVAEGLGLRPLGEERAHVERVVGGERRAPGGRRAPARELDADPGERRDVERVAAVAARHERPVDPRGLQLAMHVLGVEAALLDLRLALDQHRLQRRRPCDELARREIRLRRGDRSVGHGVLSSCDQVKCQT